MSSIDPSTTVRRSLFPRDVTIGWPQGRKALFNADEPAFEILDSDAKSTTVFPVDKPEERCTLSRPSVGMIQVTRGGVTSRYALGSSNRGPVAYAHAVESWQDGKRTVREVGLGVGSGVNISVDFQGGVQILSEQGPITTIDLWTANPATGELTKLGRVARAARRAIQPYVFS